MKNADSILGKLKIEFFFFQWRLGILNRINKLLTLAGKQSSNAINNIIDESKETSDKSPYRSIIYTLFFANLMAISLIINQKRFKFDYVDTKVIIRAIIERCITQKFILTDPIRLAKLFFCWGDIEVKRFQTSLEKVQQSNLSSFALDITFEGILFNEWTNERENYYQKSVNEWESLVKPKQEVNKAKSWSGYSIAEMAKIAGLEDIYKLIYRETSWYSHGMISVSDFYLRVTEKGIKYTSSTTNLEMIECYTQAEKLLALSFSLTDEALGWNMAKKAKKIEDEYLISKWFWGFIKLYWL